jgi:hypothetical protein
MLGGLVVVLYYLWHEGQAVAFSPLVRENALRSDPNAYPAMPTLHIIANHNDVAQFGQQVVGAEPAIPDQRQRFIAQLRSLDYQQVFALVVFSGQRGGCARFTIQRMTRWNSRVIVHANVDNGWGLGCPAIVTDPVYLLTVPKKSVPTTPIQFVLWDGWRTLATTTAIIPP